MQITINQNYENSRIDRFLRENFEAPQGIIASVIRKGKVKVNGKKVEQNARLSIGDIVTVYHHFNDSRTEVFTISKEELTEFTSWIIFENQDIFAINKPHGISSQGGVRARLSVDVMAKSYNPEARITHRLDKETSGIMIIAKNKYSARHITGLFAEGLVKKKYIAIAHFNPNVKTKGEIISNLEKDVKAQKMFTTSGRDAITHYEIANHTEDFALVNIAPQTGKMHQIRVHLSSMNMPILGDEKYGGAPNNRMMLHAYSIEFDSLKIECSEDEDFTNFFPS